MSIQQKTIRLSVTKSQARRPAALDVVAASQPCQRSFDTDPYVYNFSMMRCLATQLLDDSE